MGPIHVGVIMIRDAFIPFYVPGGYGTMRIQPWDFVDRSPANVPALTALTPEDTARATDQLWDVWDFGLAVNDRRMGTQPSDLLLNQARDQIESACMTLQGSFSQRIALQGTAYAVELAGKSLLSDHGWTKDKLSSLGHNLSKCMTNVADEYEAVDRELVLYAASQIPHVVNERYGENEEIFSRRRVGDTVGFGQYILGELARASSDRNSRAGMDAPTQRAFPIKPL